MRGSCTGVMRSSRGAATVCGCGCYSVRLRESRCTLDALMLEPNAKFQMPPPASRASLASACCNARAAAAARSHLSYDVASMLPMNQLPVDHVATDGQCVAPQLLPRHQEAAAELKHSSGVLLVPALISGHLRISVDLAASARN